MPNGIAFLIGIAGGLATVEAARPGRSKSFPANDQQLFEKPFEGERPVGAEAGSAPNSARCSGWPALILIPLPRTLGTPATLGKTMACSHRLGMGLLN